MSKAYLLFEIRKGDRSSVPEQKLIAAASDLDEIILVAEKLASARASQKTDCDIQVMIANTREGECKMTPIPVAIRMESKVVLLPSVVEESAA